MKKEIITDNWPNGQRQYEIPYVNGQRHGLAKWWHFNGQKECEIPYVNGQIHDLNKWWHNNGQRKREALYINGSAHDLQKWWHSDGSLSLVVKWYKNQKVWEIRFFLEEQLLGDAEIELFFF